VPDGFGGVESNQTPDLAEALAVIDDERNWYTPVDLGGPDGRNTIYELSLTQTGSDEFLQERDGGAPT